MKTLIVFSFFMGVSMVSLGQKPIPLINKDYGILYAYNDSLQYETYPQANGWGYKLYLRYKLLVNQPIIPAVAGTQAFKNEKDAKKIAIMAMAKVAKGQMPPTLDAKEVKKKLNMK